MRLHHFLAGLAMLCVSAAARGDGLSIFISADMEGTVGTVTGDQLDPDGFEYERYREFMTAEVNAAIAAAKSMGATRIVVADSHANGENLLIERLPKDVLVVRSWPRPLGMMQGIETGDFDAALLIGYHAAEGRTGAVLAHTWSGSEITGVRINGELTSEGRICAALAGQFDVPVILVSGDAEHVREMQEVLGDVEPVVVKWPYGLHSALTLTPQAAYDLIGDKTRAALRRLPDFKPFRLDGPLTLDIRFGDSSKAERMSYMPLVERVDAHTIRYQAKDILDVQKFLFAVSYTQ